MRARQIKRECLYIISADLHLAALLRYLPLALLLLVAALAVSLPRAAKSNKLLDGYIVGQSTAFNRYLNSLATAGTTTTAAAPHLELFEIESLQLANHLPVIQQQSSLPRTTSSSNGGDKNNTARPQRINGKRGLVNLITKIRIMKVCCVSLTGRLSNQTSASGRMFNTKIRSMYQ